MNYSPEVVNILQTRIEDLKVLETQEVDYDTCCELYEELESVRIECKRYLKTLKVFVSKEQTERNEQMVDLLNDLIVSLDSIIHNHCLANGLYPEGDEE